MAQVARKCPELNMPIDGISVPKASSHRPPQVDAENHLGGISLRDPCLICLEKIRKQVIENPERFFLLSDVLWILYGFTM